MPRFVLAVLAAATLTASQGALARESPVPDRRFVPTAGQILNGTGIESVRETTLEACRMACLRNRACRGLNFDARAYTCRLLSRIEGQEPFAGSISARIVETSFEVRRLARQRASELSFLDPPQLRAARDLAARVGTRVVANDGDWQSALATAAQAERIGNFELAAHQYAVAATIADGADAWRGLARILLGQEGGDYRERLRRNEDALSAAIDAYLRSDANLARVEALEVMAEALDKLEQGRRMIEALRLGASIAERAETATKLDDALSRHGFRVTGHTVDSDSATARICIQFSDPLAGERIDYAPYVRIRGGDRLPVEAGDRQLCVDGVRRGERYEVTVRAGLPSAAGEPLHRAVRISAHVRDRRPAVRFVGPAYVLPRSANAAIPIRTVNATTVEIAIHRLGERSLLPAVRDLFFNRALDRWREEEIADRRGEAVWSGTSEVHGALNKEATTAIPIGEAVGRFQPGVYVMTARVPGVHRRYERAATQWFIVTDLGLATMKGIDGLHVFVRSLSSAQPVEGAKINLLARNNEILASEAADARGYARFAPGLTRGAGGMAPAMLTVATEGDFAFLDLAMPGFDLSDRGVEGRPAPGPVDVFAATERGVYRPGEVVHLVALARDEHANAIGDLPLTLVVERPDGVEHHRALLEDQGAGGRAHSFPLGAGVPRGVWALQIHTDPATGPVVRKSFLVEDFVPERIDFDLGVPHGMLVPSEPVSISLAARHLHGAPGADLAVSGTIRVAEAKSLAGFPGFRFGLADERVNAVSEPLASIRTDARGEVRFQAPIPSVGPATKPLEAIVTVHVRDESGRPVERNATRALAPAGPLIGIRPLFGGQAPEDGLARFEAVAVGDGGRRMALEGVDWSLSRITRDWLWYRHRGVWRHEPVTSRHRVADGTVSLGAEERAVIEVPVEWGRYEIELSATGETRAAASHRFDAGWYAGDATADAPDVLAVGLDRDEYRLGDTATLRLEPRTDGEVLIAVLDNRLIESRTLAVTAGETSAELLVTEDWGPGAYVTATLVRPMDPAAGRNPARALGLAWARVDPGDRALDVAFTTPDEVAPRGPLDASVRIENLPAGETAYVAVAAVDAGILNLTGFPVPDPDAHYFGQRALGVEMRDLYGRLIDGMQGVRGTLRQGGDGYSPRSRTRTPPAEALVAEFSGVVEAGEDGTASARFSLPDFNGTVRLTAVAWSRSAVGHAAKDVLVRDPIVVAAAAPRFLAPGDRSRIRFELTHVKGPAGEVSVELESEAGIELGSGTVGWSTTLGPGETRGFSVPIAATAIGDARVRIDTTTPGGATLTKELTLPVRHNDPERVRRARITLAADGGSYVIDAGAFAGLAPGTARATLASGAVAAFDAPGLLMELDRYPYGCTEQQVSRALPLLHLHDVADALDLGRATGVSERIEAVIARILSNQSGAGSFGLWRAGRGDPWLDAYVTDFLSRASAEGRSVPASALKAALENLSSTVNYAADFRSGGEAVAYALMVLAREGRASIGDLRYYADAKADALATPMARAQLGAALAFYGERARSDRLFRMATTQVLTASDAERGRRADYGSHLRDAAAVLALAAEAGSDAVDVPALTDAIRARGRGPTSTQEKAWMLLATSALLKRGTPGLRVDGEPPEGPIVRTIRPGEVSHRPITVENAGPATEIVLTTAGVPTEPGPAGGNGYRIERSYYSPEGEQVGTERVAQNARLVAVLTVETEQDLAGRLIVDDPLPAGFEIDNPHLLRAGAIDAFPWLTPSDEVRTAEFRTDRFLAAVDHDGKGTFHLAYIVRAVSPGHYRHPAAIVEDMYRPEHRAWTKTGRVEVVAAP